MSDSRSWRQRLAAFAAALPLSARERRWQVISRLAAQSGNNHSGNDRSRSARRMIGDDPQSGLDHGDASERLCAVRSRPTGRRGARTSSR